MASLKAPRVELDHIVTRTRKVKCCVLLVLVAAHVVWVEFSLWGRIPLLGARP
jgi:hypothetical protein